MNEKSLNPEVFRDHVVLSKIYIIRNYKVMIDRDLADLYGIETKRLKESS